MDARPNFGSCRRSGARVAVVDLAEEVAFPLKELGSLLRKTQPFLSSRESSCGDISVSL